MENSDHNYLVTITFHRMDELESEFMHRFTGGIMRTDDVHLGVVQLHNRQELPVRTNHPGALVAALLEDGFEPIAIHIAPRH